MKGNRLVSAALVALPLTSAMPAFSGSIQDKPSVASVQYAPRGLDPSTLRYRAFGDSYSAGPGAGTSPQIEILNKCKRYNGAYPHKLNAMLRPGTTLSDEDFVSCTGAVAEEIGEQAKQHMTSDIDLVSRSLSYRGSN
jgi:hypothetical protein